MKLRNKKTGEIIETDFDLSISIPDDEKLYGCDTYTQLKGYTSLAELNEEWEDAPEEPKTHWMIDTSVLEPVREIAGQPYEIDKEIGNWFSTKEEAELAVRKLKAWKRLKDKGFRFDSYDVANRGGDNVICGQVYFKAGNYDREEIEDDLHLIFGGEE